jgi:dienelactone hydrolase
VIRRLATLLLAVGISSTARAGDLPYPSGMSHQTIEGLGVHMVLPTGLSPASPASLVVILHGNGGTSEGMAGSLASWTAEGYVVCAPKSTGIGWNDADVAAVKRIAAHVKSVLPIDPARVHVVGFSNGGWNLAPIAFDDALHPCSATWVAAGFKGGSVPKWAATGMGAMALAGSEDGNVDAARGTVTALEGKVRSVEVRVQPALGHAWPDQLMPYLKWWMGVQEGRFVPGDDLSFDWTTDLDAAIASLAGKKKGGVFVYAYDAADAAKPEAKAIQHEVFFDPEVRRLGAQLVCVRLDRATSADRLAALGISETPALAVLDLKGAPKKVLVGKVKASALAKALKAVAPEKTAPKD